MQITILRDLSNVSPLLRQWNDLKQRVGNDDFFPTWEWAQAAQALNPTLQPVLVCGTVIEQSAERLVGLAPLAVRNGALEFLAGDQADYCDLLVEAEYRRDFVNAVLQFTKEFLRNPANGCARLRLNHWPEHSATQQCFLELAQAEKLFVAVCPANVGMILQIEGTDEQALDQLLLKERLVRKAKKLGRQGKLEFRIVREPAEITACLKKHYELHTVRYLLNGQTSIYDNDHQGNICVVLDHLAGQQAEGLCVPTLFFNGQPIALTIAFEQERVMTLYATTFDVGIISNSPGEILALEITRYCRAAGLRRLDFGMGDEPYKSRFTNAQRQNNCVVIHRSALMTRLTGLLAQAKVSLKQQPFVYGLVSRLKRERHLLQLEAERVGTARASGNYARLKVSRAFASQPESFAPAAAGADSNARKINPEELAGLVWQHRRDLPSWEFRNAWEALRQGAACFLEHLHGRPSRIRIVVPPAQPEAQVVAKPASPDSGTQSTPPSAHSSKVKKQTAA